MYRLLIVIFCITLISSTSFAMGSKSNPVQSGEIPSLSNIELAKKLAEVRIKASMPDALFSKLATPLKKEFETSWNVKSSFEDTLKQIDNLHRSTMAPFMGFAKEIVAKAYAEKFTKSELEELLKIYESSLIQKESELLATWFIDEALRAFKDQKIWQQYTQQFAGIFTAVLITGMQTTSMIEALSTTASKDLEKISREINMDLTTEEGLAAFRVKIQTTYPSLAPFIPMVEGMITQAIAG